MGDYIERKTLEDGKVLLVLKHGFIENRCTETFIPFLSCLRDSEVWVPMIAILSEADQQSLLGVREGDLWQNKEEIRMKPDTLRSPDGKLWFPVFTQKEQIPEDYAQGFSIVPLPTLRCLNMAHAIDGVEGIVVDAFTDTVVLEFELADIMENIPSRLAPE